MPCGAPRPDRTSGSGRHGRRPARGASDADRLGAWSANGFGSFQSQFHAPGSPPDAAPAARWPSSATSHPNAGSAADNSSNNGRGPLARTSEASTGGMLREVSSRVSRLPAQLPRPPDRQLTMICAPRSGRPTPVAHRLVQHARSHAHSPVRGQCRPWSAQAEPVRAG